MTNIEPPFNLEGKYTSPFKEMDPFNSNLVEGYINRTPNRKYGNLWITKVNGQEAPQHIWATPKLHYPHDYERRFHFPPKVEGVEVYEKFDGSNILAYRYQDADGNEFLTYKLRLRPFLVNSRWGDFLDMWNELLEADPRIRETCLNNPCNTSWELYGSRNMILIVYDIPLATKLLFGRGPNGEVIAPAHLVDDHNYSAPLITTIGSDSDYPAEYEKIIQYLNGRITVKTRKNEEDLVTGQEGAVWYMLAGDTILYKCKPEYVQDIHWKQGEGIPRHSVYITCMNAFEESDDPDLDLIIRLLLEEFTEDQIQMKSEMIEKVFSRTMADLEFKREVIEEYRNHPELDINADIRGTMMHFSTMYPKNLIGRVFGTLQNMFGR